jgi:flagellar hook assembly protein FlgD
VVVPIRLVQNHPNPFNPATTIVFELDLDSHVRLDIFDPAGRHILNLTDRAYVPGRHSARWDGRDSAGQPVASGVYLYRLQGAGQVLSQRMVLSK